MDEIKRKKLSQGALRRHFKNKLEQRTMEILNDFTPEKLTELKSLKTNLENQFEKIRLVDDEIAALIEEEEAYTKEIENNLEFADQFFLIIAKVNECITKNTESPPSSLPEIASSTDSVKTVEAKLPKIKLPNFDGDILKWQTFWDQYESSIHERTDIANISKFSYLKSLLTSKASDCITGLALTKDNYSVAINILKERFGGKQQLINAHMESLQQLPTVRNMNQVKELRTLYDKLESTVRNLHSLDIKMESYGCFLVPNLMQKMPNELRMIISRHFKSDVWDMKTILSMMKDELEAKERCSNVQSTSKHSSNNEQFSTSAFYQQTRELSCVFCSKRGHTPSQCLNVTEVKARVALLRKKARCFVCLQSGHISKDCTKEYLCNNCERRHHISLCEHEKKQSTTNQTKQTSTQANTAHSNHTNVENAVLLQTGRANILNIAEKNTVFSRILFDGGSQRSYILKSLVDKLQLPVVRRERVVLGTFGNLNCYTKEMDVVQFAVESRNGSTNVYVEALVTPEICSPLSHQHPLYVQTQYEHLRNLYLSDYENCHSMNVQILIGSDFYYSFMTGKIVRGNEGEPTAVESSVGWILSGPYKPPPTMSVNLVNTHVMKSSVSDENFHRFWEIESICDPPVKETLLSDIEFNGERYVNKLPFKPYHELLPDNYSHSQGRLSSLRRKLQKDPELEGTYQKVFDDYERDGIIQKVCPESDPPNPGSVHYLPHRAVVRQERETTKVRVVFDASSKTAGPSLNDCLYSGPNLLSKIFDILTRFRLNKIAITSDIKQAFLNIAIHEEHRDFLRFLWFDKQSDEEIIYRFNRVVFGLTSSPFLLQGTIHHHFHSLESTQNLDSKFVELLLENLYVDDLIDGADTVAEGYEFYRKAKGSMADGGFTLRKWVTNCNELQTLINEKETDNTAFVESNSDELSFSDYQFGVVNTEKELKSVLGVMWDTVNDEFIFEFENIIEKSSSIELTKRNILSVASSFYDPLGLISPITIQSKVIFQALCNRHYDWDAVVQEPVLSQWKEFISRLESMQRIRIPRFIFSISDDIQLHGFCDSSQSAYCAAVYVRKQTSEGVSVNLLTSKTKVAPLKKLTIPRLELLSCLLLADLVQSVFTAANLQTVRQQIQCFYWSDSEIALCWIKSIHKEWRQWVENRVNRIRSLTDHNKWSHISGTKNPADIATRTAMPDDLLPNALWFNGPEFLSHPVTNWPDTSIPIKETTAEIKPVKETITCHTNVQSPNIANIIQVEKFSDVNRLKRTMAYVLRFIHNLRNNDKVTEQFLSVSEINQAELIFLKFDQSVIRGDERFHSVEKSLNLFEDEDGLLRARGRLENAELSSGQKFPILLRDSHFTRLLIWKCHLEVFHGGVEATLNRLRVRFWVVKGRQVVKRVLHRCATCRRHQARPMVPPPSPALPSYRLASEYCFETTGTDFAGPCYVKSIFVKNDVLFKAYICIFTCSTSRAVHLELTPDIDGPAFVRAMKRFISRRGYPRMLLSDNAKYFKSKEVKSFLLQNCIQKEFILPASPWWGGFYERLVRSVKLPLRKVLGKARLTYEEMETTLIEVEGIINSRPLTYLYDDVSEPLTPSHLLTGRNMSARSNETIPSGMIKPATNIGKRARYVQRTIQQFWNCFQRTYFSELREQHMYAASRTRTSKTNSLNVGDVVVIKEDNLVPRSTWRIAKVESLVIGRDNHVRGAVVTTISKEGRRTRVTRPLQKLINLEVDEFEKHSELETNEPVEEQVEQRPRRQAAVIGELKRRMDRQ